MIEFSPAAATEYMLNIAGFLLCDSHFLSRNDSFLEVKMAHTHFQKFRWYRNVQ